MTSTFLNIVEPVSKGVKALDDFQTKAKDWEDGSKLKKAIDTIGGTWLSKTSASMSLIGTGLSLLGIVKGGESDTTKILSAISDVDKKIDNLQAIMLGKFDHLESVVEWVGAQVTISSAIAKINSVATTANVLIQATDDVRRKAALRDLKAYSKVDLRNAVAEIDTTLHGELGNKVFESKLSASYGHAEEISDLARSLLYYVQQAFLLDVLLGTIGVLPEEQLFTFEEALGHQQFEELDLGEDCNQAILAEQENSEIFYQTFIENLRLAWLDSLEKSKDDCKSYISKYLKTERFPYISGSNRNICNSIVGSIEHRWKWLDFMVITYNGKVKGYEHHINSGMVDRRLSYFRQKLKSGQINTVIVWAEKDDDVKGYSLTTKTKHHGAAEDHSWSDLLDMEKDLENRASSRRLVFACVRNKGVEWHVGNSRRLHSRVGKKYTVCLFE